MKLLAAGMLALVLPGSAFGALAIKLTVAPKTPEVGAATTVKLRPYWVYKRADGSCCVLRPSSVGYPFRVEAVDPNGRVHRVRVRRTADRFVWSALFRFRVPGRWVLRDPQWGPRYSRNYGARPRIAVTVQRG
jgi:hypothetical protein